MGLLRGRFVAESLYCPLPPEGKCSSCWWQCKPVMAGSKCTFSMWMSKLLFIFSQECQMYVLKINPFTIQAVLLSYSVSQKVLHLFALRFHLKFICEYTRKVGFFIYNPFEFVVKDSLNFSKWITESLRLDKTFKIIKSNLRLNTTTMTTKPYRRVPYLLILWILPGMVNPQLPWGSCSNAYHSFSDPGVLSD